MARRIGAVMVGAGTAMWPLLALAEGEAVSRVAEAPPDAAAVMIIVVLALLGVFGIGALGYAYRRQHNLDWAFQRPDEPQDAHH